ncbi:iron-sulfur cluster assembly factor IBA57, mitochondrial-like [Dermatophagoides pteronyssinus]|uniref:Iron-sulfur clusters incorporation protein n=1 Tax=Dermatophagoides pteronyssinus TaxID=6956 RepID=A0ABQ8JG77_DERPT|nr:Iron-sulfur clusters incorporation protein [Dermatophagoides pteronyssinus]
MFKLKSTFIRYSYRHLSTKSYYLANLKSKNLLTITGKDSIDFLQGLITNDVRYKSNDNHSNSTSCIYSFILNNTGRIIADLFVHRLITKQNDNDAILLLEVDQQISSILIKLLKRYKIKSKVSIKQSDTNDWHCYSLFPTVIENNLNEIIQINNNESNTIFVNDPRNNYFGYKILTKIQSNNELLSFLNEMNPTWKIIDIDENRYRSFRYQYGIGEGSLDFPIETSLPFDANGDILNGISFQKGCYIGQELTARTYHTGVIRKRIMPIKIIDPLVESNEMLPLQNVIDSDGKNVGRFRSNYGDQGLAVLKFDSISSDSRLKLSKTGHRIRTWRPFWWPESIIEQQMKLESS